MNLYEAIKNNLKESMSNNNDSVLEVMYLAKHNLNPDLAAQLITTYLDLEEIDYDRIKLDEINEELSSYAGITIPFEDYERVSQDILDKAMHIVKYKHAADSNGLDAKAEVLNALVDGGKVLADSDDIEDEEKDNKPTTIPEYVEKNIEDEEEAIDYYNKFIAFVKENKPEHSEKIIEVIAEIMKDEEDHINKLVGIDNNDFDVKDQDEIN